MIMPTSNGILIREYLSLLQPFLLSKINKKLQMSNAVIKWAFLDNLRGHIIKINGVMAEKTAVMERSKCQKTTITLFAKRRLYQSKVNPPMSLI